MATKDGDQVDDVKLYGVMEAEVMYLDPASVYETDYEPWLDEHDRRPLTIEEWSAIPAAGQLMAVDSILGHIIEMSCEEWGEGGIDKAERAAQDPEVVAAFEAARAVLASKVDYWLADKRLRTLTVTWDDAGNPLLDGEPMYVKA